MDDWFSSAQTNNVDLLASHSVAHSGTFNTEGSTALMLAAAKGHLEAIAFLMESEALVTRPTGWTALMEAAYNGQTRAVLMLAPDLAKRQLVSEDGVFSQGTTALIVAATLGHQECILALLDEEKEVSRWSDVFVQLFRGESVTLVPDFDSAGRSPLMYYAMHSHKQLFAPNLHRTDSAKLSAGRIDFAGYSALMHAVRTNNIKFISYILSERLPDLGIVSAYSRRYSALMMAAEQGNLEICELLASEEAGLANPYGLCALDIAIINGHYNIALLFASAEAHIPIHKMCTYIYDLYPDMTPCDIARKYGTPEMVSLLSQGSKPELTLSALNIDHERACSEPTLLLKSNNYRTVVSLPLNANLVNSDERKIALDCTALISTSTSGSLFTEKGGMSQLQSEVFSLYKMNTNLKQRLEQINEEYNRTKADLNQLRSDILQQTKEHSTREATLENSLRSTKLQLERSVRYSQEIYTVNSELQNKLERARDALIMLREERKSIAEHDTTLFNEYSLLKRNLLQLESTTLDLQAKESTMLELIKRFIDFYDRLGEVVQPSRSESPELRRTRKSSKLSCTDKNNRTLQKSVLSEMLDFVRESCEDILMAEKDNNEIILNIIGTEHNKS